MRGTKTERELLNEAEEKWTEGSVAGIYSAVLPMESLTDNLNNIIFNYSVGEFLKIRQQILNFALIFFNRPP